MEWDKIWSLNRKMLDKACHRYTAISSENKATIEIVDTEDKHFESHESQLHPKDKS